MDTLILVGRILTILIRGFAVLSLVVGLFFAMFFDIYFGALTVDLVLVSVYVSFALSFATGALTTVILRVGEIISTLDPRVRWAIFGAGVSIRLLDSILDSLYFWNMFATSNNPKVQYQEIIEGCVIFFAIMISLLGDQLALWVARDGFKTVFERLLGVRLGESPRGSRVQSSTSTSHSTSGGLFSRYESTAQNVPAHMVEQPKSDSGESDTTHTYPHYSRQHYIRPGSKES